MRSDLSTGFACSIDFTALCMKWIGSNRQLAVELSAFTQIPEYNITSEFITLKHTFKTRPCNAVLNYNLVDIIKHVNHNKRVCQSYWVDYFPITGRPQVFYSSCTTAPLFFFLFSLLIKDNRLYFLYVCSYVVKQFSSFSHISLFSLSLMNEIKFYLMMRLKKRSSSC